MGRGSLLRGDGRLQRQLCRATPTCGIGNRVGTVTTFGSQERGVTVSARSTRPPVVPSGVATGCLQRGEDMRSSKLAAISFCLLLLVAPAMWGQAVSTSQISGVVQDPSGANIPGANVKVTQVAT